LGMARLHTILVADDDPDVREVMVEALADAGYPVFTATDGYDAVGILADNWVNLLITDITMPGIDGFELARQAKVMRPNIKVLYISGYLVDTPKMAGITCGPIMQKPMRSGHLLDEVNRLLA
jgi:two-component system cell cycle response regulator CpdR